MLKKIKAIIIFSFFVFMVIPGFAQRLKNEAEENSPEKGILILQKYFLNENNWHVTRPELVDQVKGLIHFVESEPLDSILTKLNQTVADSGFSFVYRLPGDVPDSLSIPGFYSSEKLTRDIENIGLKLQSEFQEKEPVVPVRMLTNIEEKVAVIKPGEGFKLRVILGGKYS